MGLAVACWSTNHVNIFPTNNYRGSPREVYIFAANFIYLVFTVNTRREHGNLANGI